MSVTLDHVRKAQLKRNDLVKLLAQPNMSELVSGCFVRVLLELENQGEDYRIGLIQSVDHGQSYNGFTHDLNVSTTQYLHLQLQGNLMGINGSHYQLNSISNQPISDNEMKEWEQECPLDLAPLTEAAQKVRTASQIARGGVVPPSNGAAPAAPQQQQQPQPQQQQQPGLQAAPSAAFPPQALGTTVVQGRSSRGNNGDVDLDMPTADQIRRQCLDDCRNDKAVFPRDLTSFTTSQLRVVERELIDYLEKTRDAISSNQPNCVVCMDKLPTVITLPCKHKVLCRLCATQVTHCPVCRESVVEMFEPVEI